MSDTVTDPNAKYWEAVGKFYIDRHLCHKILGFNPETRQFTVNKGCGDNFTVPVADVITKLFEQ